MDTVWSIWILHICVSQVRDRELGLVHDTHVQLAFVLAFVVLFYEFLLSLFDILPVSFELCVENSVSSKH